MMQRQEQFQQEAQQQMQKAQADAMAPIYKKLDDAIKAVGAAEGVIYIFDLARTPIPYVNETLEKRRSCFFLFPFFHVTLRI